MANSRPEEKATKSAEETIRRAGEETTEQTRRIGLAVARTGEEMTQSSANLLQQNAEILQNSWRLGVELATTIVGRSTDQFGRTFGLTGDGAQQAAQRSARNAETVLYSATAVSKEIEGISREYFDFVRRQIEKSMDSMNQYWSCRNLQEFTAVQTDLMRDTVASMIESSRRVADMSGRLAEDAGRHITEQMRH